MPPDKYSFSMKPKKAPPIKPTGVKGSIRLSPGSSESAVSWEQVEFPRDKEGIERFIVDGFLLEAKKVGMVPADAQAKQNPQDDFDFTLIAGGRTMHLELMEAVMLSGGGYEKAPQSLDAYEYASDVMSKIEGKSAKYGITGRGELALLIYVTDYRFGLEGPSLDVLRLFCRKEEGRHGFSHIFLYTPRHPGGTATQIFPTPSFDPLFGHDPEAYRGKRVTKYDLRQAASEYWTTGNCRRNEQCPCGSRKKYKHCHGKLR